MSSSIASTFTSSSSKNFTDLWAGSIEDWDCRKVTRGDTDISVGFRVYDANRKFEAAFGDWMAMMRIANLDNVTIGDLNGLFGAESVPVPRYVSPNKPRRIAMPYRPFYPLDDRVLLKDLLYSDERHVMLYFRFTDEPPVDADGFEMAPPVTDTMIHFDIHDVNGNDMCATISEWFSKDAMEHLTFGEIALDYAKQMVYANHLFVMPKFSIQMTYNGNAYPNATLLRNMVEPGQKEMRFVFKVCLKADYDSSDDEANISEWYYDLDFEAEAEKFLHEVDMHYEEELYTAQDHAERRPSTMDFAREAQAKRVRFYEEFAAEKTQQTPELLPWGFIPDFPWQQTGAYAQPDPFEAPEPIYLEAGKPSPEFTMCIPRVFSNITEKRIRTIFQNLGFPKIQWVKLITCTGINRRTGEAEDYNRAFIHFESLSCPETKFWVRMKLREILAGETIKIMYEDPWFWKASISKLKINRPEVV